MAVKFSDLCLAAFLISLSMTVGQCCWSGNQPAASSLTQQVYDPGVNTVFYGRVLRLWLDPWERSYRGHETYSAEVLVLCSLETMNGWRMNPVVNVSLLGYPPGNCYVTNLEADQEYIIFGHDYGNPNGTIFHLDMPAVPGTRQNLNLVASACGLKARYPKGYDDDWERWAELELDAPPTPYSADQRFQLEDSEEDDDDDALPRSRGQGQGQQPGGDRQDSRYEDALAQEETERAAIQRRRDRENSRIDDSDELDDSWEHSTNNLPRPADGDRTARAYEEAWKAAWERSEYQRQRTGGDGTRKDGDNSVERRQCPRPADRRHCYRKGYVGPGSDVSSARRSGAPSRTNCYGRAAMLLWTFAACRLLVGC